MGLRRPLVLTSVLIAGLLLVGEQALAQNKKAVKKAQPAVAPAPAAPVAAPAETVVMPPLQKERAPLIAPNSRAWKEQDPSELRLLQIRPYSLENKFEVGVLGGFSFSDPFLSVKQYGGLLGYHLDDFFGVEALAWAYSDGSSSALTQLQQNEGATANINPVRHFYGGELTYSPCYGKVALVGKLILNLDFHVAAGAGQITTDTGSYFAPIAGVTEQFFMGRGITLRLSFRMLYYSEMLLQQSPTAANYGKLFGPRGNLTSLVDLGVSYLL